MLIVGRTRYLHYSLLESSLLYIFNKISNKLNIMFSNFDIMFNILFGNVFLVTLFSYMNNIVIFSLYSTHTSLRFSAIYEALVLRAISNIN